jgi:streptomycin 6-kinase
MLADLHDRLHLVPARQSSDPTSRILHMDLHPGNVMMVEQSPVVIDWRNTIEGNPNLDVAMSALILAEAGISSVRVAGSARAVLETFLECVHAEPATMLDDAVVLRGRDPNLSGEEVRQLDAAASLVRELASQCST